MVFSSIRVGGLLNPNGEPPDGTEMAVVFIEDSVPLLERFEPTMVDG